MELLLAERNYIVGLTEYNPRRQKIETQRVERSLLLPRSMLIVLIMKKTDRMTQSTGQTFNLRSLPVNLKDLSDKEATGVLSELAPYNH